MPTNQQQEQFKLVVDDIVYETPGALLVRVNAQDVWLPFSQIHSIHHESPPYVMVTPWIAKKKGLL